MGLCIHTRDLKAKINVGYIRFSHYRRWIADCINAEAGAIYEKQYSIYRYEFTEKELERMQELFPEDARLFLYHSDCDGSFSAKECRIIVGYLKQIELKPSRGMSQETFEFYKREFCFMLSVFEYAAKRRVKLYFC